jgi:hypothetical protein
VAGARFPAGSRSEKAAPFPGTGAAGERRSRAGAAAAREAEARPCAPAASPARERPAAHRASFSPGPAEHAHARLRSSERAAEAPVRSEAAPWPAKLRSFAGAADRHATPEAPRPRREPRAPARRWKRMPRREWRRRDAARWQAPCRAGQ